ncbi:hypothetical protein GQ472_04655 [archaeon]|nr:hypothetical protein [archaeon]
MDIYKSLELSEIASFSGSDDVVENLRLGLDLISKAGYKGAEILSDLTELDNYDFLKNYIDTLNSDGKIFEISLHLPKKFSYIDSNDVFHRASFNLFDKYNKEWADESRKFLEGYVRIAESLGVKYLNLHIEGLYKDFLGGGYEATKYEKSACDSYWNEIDKIVHEMLKSNLEVIEEIAYGTEIPITVENHELPYHMSSPGLLKIFEDYPSLNFLFDIGHPLKHLSMLEKGNDWGITEMGDKKRIERCIAEFGGMTYEQCIKDGGVELLSRFISTKAPFAAHMHQINTIGEDHLPLFRPEGIISLGHVAEMLFFRGTEVIVIESFEKNDSEEEYLNRIKDELEIIKG